MGNSRCFVPGCNTGYHRKENKDGKRYSMFMPPQDTVLLAKWKIAIRRKDKELTRNDRVCELHFTEDDIERFYVTKLLDGTIHKLEKGKPSLKYGSIPTQFPYLPSYLSKKAKKRKLPSKNDVSDSQINKVATVAENVLSPSIDIDDYNVNLNCLQKITFENLMKASHMKPNKWWSISEVGDVIACARWNYVFDVEKRIIINADLQAKVYVKEQEVVIPDLTKVASVDDVFALLRRVERFNICAGVNRFKDCLVCLVEGTGGKRKWCSQCKISIRREYNAKQTTQNEIIIAAREERRKMNLRNEKRKNKRLLNKVNKLHRRLQIYEKLCPSIKSEIDKISSMFITTDSAENSSINTTNLEDEDSSENIDCDILYN